VRQNLGRVTRAVLFSALGFVICVGFQNCSGYASDFNPLYDQATLNTCIGLACGQDDTLLRLSINNDTAVYVKNAAISPACGSDDSSCVDLGGYCDDGGFPDNEITYSIAGGAVTVPETLLAGTKCVDGRFSAQVHLPAGYDFASIHALRLTIKGITSTGDLVTSSAGGNYREVNVVSY
jgi:hypothetical protein